MQAQMTGLLLGVLIQLSLADSHCLAQHIYKVEGLQLLHDIAMARTHHTHPESQDASEVKRLRPDVYEKLFQIYRQVKFFVIRISSLSSQECQQALG